MGARMSQGMGFAGKVASLTTMVGAGLSLLSIALKVHPALETVKHLKEAVDLYTLYIRAPLERLLTILVPWPRTWLTSVMVDGLMFWIAFFLAVNLFVYRHERNFLPGHIYRSYCQLGAPGVGSGALCVLPKILLAFVAAPIVCIVFAITKFRAPSDRLFSAAYITLEPRTILNYVLTLVAAVASAIVLSELALRSYP